MPLFYIPKKPRLIVLDIFMIDCTKQSFLEHCKKEELNHMPQLELRLYDNTFKYFHDFSPSHFEDWVTEIFDKEPSERKNYVCLIKAANITCFI